MLQCQTCGGTYYLIQADGARYFHACPPVDYSRVQRLDGSTTVVPPGDEGIRLIVELVPVPRPDARDENVHQTDPSTPGRIRAEGRGPGTLVP